MPTLQTLRRQHWLTRWVLLLFVMALQVAALSPLVQSVAAGGNYQLVCSADGRVQWVSAESVQPVQEAQQMPQTHAASHGLDCALCLPLMALPEPQWHWPAANVGFSTPSQPQWLAPQSAPAAWAQARAPPLNA